ncbi:RcpC/CpaB family pilus assembly protein [Actinoplanes sp. KI2]|uniref:Flp pilus assembly protein CpaB n=1 Tax=Actinoplanes sp. KI2 TaxID=2983315 RepID=UPI0021D5DF7E|nr:RcpC/CpaB family pilus assembly protein [Actinoplanes sp. KI2]MCU7728346.1 RcpC/CpaB family pilus assembly protein [Actinoplanes sp. KI2]
MRRRLLAVLVAAVLAGIGCIAVVGYVRGADQRALAGRQAVWVLISTQRIPAGTSAATIRGGGYTERVAMPAETVPATALGKLDTQLDTLVLSADLPPSQLLLRGMFAEPSEVTGGLPVPDGKLAVSVQVTAAGRVAGYVRPGSRVAVFSTFTMREGRGRVPAGDGLSSGHDYNQATRVLLPRVEVIGVGERGVSGAATAGDSTAAASGGDGSSAAAKAGVTMLVTVAVSQQEAEKLVHVSLTGTLSLALLDDTATVEPDAGVDNNTLFP